MGSLNYKHISCCSCHLLIYLGVAYYLPYLRARGQLGSKVIHVTELSCYETIGVMLPLTGETGHRQTAIGQPGMTAPTPSMIQFLLVS